MSTTTTAPTPQRAAAPAFREPPGRLALIGFGFRIYVHQDNGIIRQYIMTPGPGRTIIRGAPSWEMCHTGYDCYVMAINREGGRVVLQARGTKLVWLDGKFVRQDNYTNGFIATR